MSGFLVFVAFIAVATFVVLWPGVARAGTSATAPTGRSLTGERYAPIYIKYGDIKGEIVPAPSLKLDFLKLNGDGCSQLVVVAMRKAGGEQQEFKTHAMPGSKPGECIYSFKQLPLGTYDIGVQEIHFKPSDVKSLDHKHKDEVQFLKIAQDYKQLKGETAYYLKYGGQFDKWVPATAGGVFIKGEHKEITIDGKASSLTGPVLTYTGPT